MVELQRTLDNPEMSEMLTTCGDVDDRMLRNHCGQSCGQ